MAARARAGVGDACVTLRRQVRQSEDVAASLRDGDPRHTIVACAREWGADLVVLGSHGKKGLDRMLGSVSDSVARHAPCSVEIVRAASTAA